MTPSSDVPGGSNGHAEKVHTHAVDGFAAFVDRYGDEAAEVAWMAGLAWLERAADSAREGKWGRFRHYPGGELRRLRLDVSRALQLCRDNDLMRALTQEARAAVAASGKARRREQTREAERVRLEKAAARRSRPRKST
jgi:hypothetical protein